LKTLNPIVKCAITGLTLGLLALVVIFGFVCTGCSKHEGTDVVSAPTEDCWTTKVVTWESIDTLRVIFIGWDKFNETYLPDNYMNCNFEVEILERISDDNGFIDSLVFITKKICWDTERVPCDTL